MTGHINYRVPALIALVLLAVAPVADLGIMACPFFTVTGIACPGCGVTRSMSAFMSLEFVDSFRYHPLGGVLVSLCLWYVLLNRPVFSAFPQHVSKRIGASVRLILTAGLFGLVWCVRLVV